MVCSISMYVVIKKLWTNAADRLKHYCFVLGTFVLVLTYASTADLNIQIHTFPKQHDCRPTISMVQERPALYSGSS